MPLFMIIVSLIDPIQIQGQPINDNNTGETQMMPPYMSEDQCNDPNSPVGSADDVQIPCKNTSTPQTPEVTACFDATPDRPTICRESPVGSQRCKLNIDEN